MTAIDDPRAPGHSTGVIALTLAVLPAVWIGTYLLLGGLPATSEFRSAMLVAEPFALPVIAALAIVVALFALWRDTRAGRVLAVIALAAVALQVAVVVALIAL